MDLVNRLQPAALRAAALVVGLVTAMAMVSGSEILPPADSGPENVLVESDGNCSDCPTGACRAELDVWVASTRRLPGICRVPEQADLAIERLTGSSSCRRWEGANLDALLAEPWRPLVFFIHGNRYEPADAKTQGLELASRMSHCHSCSATPRVVILSWPSQKQGLLLKDGRRKYDRAYADGHYLAWLLGRVHPEQPVAIIGYSFGALVAAEALDGVAHQANDESTIRWADRPGRTHLVFIAPALRCDALAPRGTFRESIAGVDRFTLLINSRDEALRFFPLLEPHVRSPALGYVGMPRRWLPAEVEYTAVDASSFVGKMHTMRRYLDSQPLAERITSGALTGLAGE
jgi:esterase/lipase superfamily enzyme